MSGVDGANGGLGVHVAERIVAMRRVGNRPEVPDERREGGGAQGVVEKAPAADAYNRFAGRARVDLYAANHGVACG